MEKYEVSFRKFRLSGIQEYIISTDYSFYNKHDKLRLECSVAACYRKETHPSILRGAMYLALSEYLVDPYCSHEIHCVNWPTAILYSYYTDTQYSCDKVVEIDKKKLDEIKEWYIRLSNNTQIENSYRTQWGFALNEYYDTCRLSSLEQNYLHLIVALEALLVRGNNGVRGKVIWNTSKLCGESEQERIQIKKVLNNAYNIRSETVHGNVKQLIKKLKQQDAYEKYFKLKKIVSCALLKTYGKDKDVLIDELNKEIL